MTIEAAVAALATHLGEPDVFTVRHDGKSIIVDVNSIYRVADVTALGGIWHDFRVVTGRRSCW